MTTDLTKPIHVKFFLLFIPAAYASYLFHEFGHWTLGEVLGNRMVFSLNFVWPENGRYLQAGHELYSSIGGPAFSILQATMAFLVIERRKVLYAYPFAFFPMFSRFFSDLLGGYAQQDETRISVLMGTWTYLVAIIVLAILLLIVIRCSHILMLNARTNGYILMASTISQLLVIGTYTFIKI
jgi:hypothetical protein